jgi:hypothetical protein
MGLKQVKSCKLQETCAVQHYKRLSATRRGKNVGGAEIHVTHEIHAINAQNGLFRGWKTEDNIMNWRTPFAKVCSHATFETQ